MSFQIDWLQENNTRYRRSISIASNSVINFDSGFYHDNELSKYTHVTVGYDKARKAIVFIFKKFSERERIPDGLLKITRDSRGNSGKIAALALFKRNNINIQNYTGKYPPHFEKDAKYGGLYYINLDERNKIES